MKIAVFGNRNINSVKRINETMEAATESLDASEIVLLHGGTKGPQTIVATVFANWGAQLVLFKPWHMVWDQIPFCTNLFFYRNKQIIENADKVIVFLDGTKDAETSRVLDLMTLYPEKSLEVVEV